MISLLKPPDLKFKYKGVFEAHITIENLDKKQTDSFIDLSKKLNFKPIQIGLDKGDHQIQSMTCSKHKGEFLEVYQQVLNLAAELEDNNFIKIFGFKTSHFKPNRIKIEAAPFNEDIPQTNKEAQLHPTTNYFEHHILLLLHEQRSLTSLYKVCKQYNAHLSVNAFSKAPDNYYHKFVTVRNYFMGKDESECLFNQLKQALLDINIKIKNSVTEYCIFDSNVALDNNWLN